MTTLTTTILRIATGLVFAAGFSAGAATASPGLSPPTSIEADADASIAPAASRLCYPRLRWTYRPGVGPFQIIVGKICIPFLTSPVRPPWPGPDPERIGPRISY